MDIINDNQEDEGEVEGEVEVQTNKSIEMNQKYFTKDKKQKKKITIIQKNLFKENKEKIKEIEKIKKEQIIIIIIKGKERERENIPEKAP